ncbi:MAG: ABC transporter ATP-binding protein [Nocardioidaceae bacterium]|nr:ABC transporter ATP-binding protein [Nocardioidaceae bacterium]
MTKQTLAQQRSHPATVPDAVVEVDGLTKAYGDHKVLKGLSLSVAAQEIFGILGPNGVGKTTAVETIQGLRSRQGGSVRVLGLDPARDRSQLRPLLGSQLQASALPERLRVGEALRLFCRLAGDVVDWRELRDTWDLARLERSSFGSLSGGERQRLFIALALANRPRVVFLDELTQGLDPAARRDTWRLIRRIREQGATVVLVSHYMDEVEQLCDRVAVLHDGCITACDSPQGLISLVGGSVRTRFSSEAAAVVSGLERIPGVESVSSDGRVVDVSGDASTPVLVAAELARRNAVPDDFTVVRPSLEDVFVTLTSGGRS